MNEKQKVVEVITSESLTAVLSRMCNAFVVIADGVVYRDSVSNENIIGAYDYLLKTLDSSRLNKRERETFEAVFDLMGWKVLTV